MTEAGISGIGILSAVGSDLPETRANLWSDTPVLPRLPRRIETALKLPVFEVTSPEKPADFPGGHPLFFLMQVVNEALHHAKLDTPASRAGLKIGVAVGTTVACQLDNIPFHAAVRDGKVSDYRAALHYVQGMPAEYLHKYFDFDGPAVTISNACASGADAALVALDWLRTGTCDIVIACGTDAVSKVSFDGFNALRVCGGEPCRPFDADRKGLNLGDGACAVILEDPAQAAKRGAEVRFVLAGAGKSADAFHITQPESSGAQLERAVREALEQADLTVSDIAYINAHGTGTAANDAVEAALFQRLFPAATAFSSTKALTGHTLGAAGALELAFSCLMLEHQLAVKNHRFAKTDANICRSPLTAHAELSDPAAVLSTSLAFGGSNTALVITPKRGGGNRAVPQVKCKIMDFCAPAPGEPDQAATVALCRKYGLRRLDRLTTMAVYTADKLMDGIPGDDTALITVSGYGPIKTTVQVVNDILDYPEDEILPVGFSHSVVNAAASYVGLTRKIHGATLALTGFDDPFFEAVQLGRTLLSTGRCRRVLLIAFDETCQLAMAVETLRRSAAPEQYEGVFAMLLGTEEGREMLLDDAPAADSRLLPCGVPAKFRHELLQNSGAVTLQRLAPAEFALP